MTVEEYREQLLEDMAVAVAADGSSTPDKEFLYYVTDILATGEEFDDFKNDTNFCKCWDFAY